MVMGEPKCDEEMAKRDTQADAANPKELSRRFSNQSASGPPSLLDPTRSVSFVTAEEQSSSNNVEQGGRARGSEAGIEIAIVQAPAEAGTSPAWLGASSTRASSLEATTEVAGNQAPKSLAALLAACGLEHLAKNFEDEEYSLEDLLSAFKSGAAKGDLRDLKLTLGECRKILSHLEATAA